MNNPDISPVQSNMLRMTDANFKSILLRSAAPAFQPPDWKSRLRYV
jgi:hypothetical protein